MPISHTSHGRRLNEPVGEIDLDAWIFGTHGPGAYQACAHGHHGAGTFSRRPRARGWSTSSRSAGHLIVQHYREVDAGPSEVEDVLDREPGVPSSPPSSPLPRLCDAALAVASSSSTTSDFYIRTVDVTLPPVLQLRGSIRRSSAPASFAATSRKSFRTLADDIQPQASCAAGPDRNDAEAPGLPSGCGRPARLAAPRCPSATSVSARSGRRATRSSRDVVDSLNSSDRWLPMIAFPPAPAGRPLLGGRRPIEGHGKSVAAGLLSVECLRLPPQRGDLRRAMRGSTSSNPNASSGPRWPLSRPTMCGSPDFPFWLDTDGHRLRGHPAQPRVAPRLAAFGGCEHDPGDEQRHLQRHLLGPPCLRDL